MEDAKSNEEMISEPQMREKIIFAPGLNGNELRKSLAVYGFHSFNMRIVNGMELARTALMRCGKTVREGTDKITYSSPAEEIILTGKALEGNDYFKKPSYSDIKAVASVIGRMRSLVTDEDEATGLKAKLEDGPFKEKNAALFEVYEKYIGILQKEYCADKIILMRRAIKDCASCLSNSEVFILNEYPVSPLEKKMLQTLTDGNYKQISIKELFEIKQAPGEDKGDIRIAGFKNCYGSTNEVEMIIDDIYRSKRVDECVVALTSPSTYTQLFFDHALTFNIPMTFGCGVPILNSNPARLLSFYIQWTETLFGSEALKKMMFSGCFNLGRLKKLYPGDSKDIKWSVFYTCLEDLKFSNNETENLSKVEKFKKAITEDGADLVKGTKAYERHMNIVKCFPILESSAKEFALPVQDFISRYAFVRFDTSSVAAAMLNDLDTAALASICKDLSFDAEDKIEIAKAVLQKNIMSQQSKPGYLHVTSVEKALSTLRPDLYIAGLSASLYPRPGKENYLLLDEDIKCFGDDAKYLLSEQIIQRDKEILITLAELASALMNEIHISYAGMNVADLKNDNASSLIYELFSRMHGVNASYDDLMAEIEKVGYFAPEISASRLVGDSYIHGFPVDPETVKYAEVEAKADLTKHYAPTAIGDFISCPRKFMLKYILGIPEPDEDEDNPLAILTPIDAGILAHELMVKLAEAKKKGGCTLDDFLKTAGEYFDRFIAEHPPLVSEHIQLERNAFLDMMTNAYTGDPGLEVVLNEEDIEFDHPSGVKLHGYPDRVEKLGDGTYLIADYKTGRREKHEDNDFETCFQAIVYACLMESQGKTVSKCEFRYIRLGSVVECVYDDEMKKKLNIVLKTFKEKMEAGEFKCNPAACALCKYSEICGKDSDSPVWEGIDYEQP